MLSIISKAQLILTPGVTLTGNAGTYIVLNNMSMQHNAATALLHPTFKFTGNADVLINSQTIPAFTNIEIAKFVTAKVVLGNEISVFGNIVFTSGFLDLRGSIVNLGSTGLLLNEKETSRIVETVSPGGYTVSSQNINAPNAFNPGNLGAEITSSANLGLVTIKREEQQKTGNGLARSILRSYDINAANNTALNATLSLHYFDAELNGLDEQLLRQFRTTSGTNYSNMSFTSNDWAANYVLKNNYATINALYTLSTDAGALPVTLSGFTAQCKTNFIQLSWKTQQEQNSDRFDIQRSDDGTAWEKIGSIKAAGNSSNTLSYQYDDHTLNTASAYYRLAQYDKDGKFTYSIVVKAGCGWSTEFKVMPNPVADIAKVLIGSKTNSKGTIILYNAAGQQVMQQDITLTTGTNQYQLNMSALAKGTYTLMFVQAGAIIETTKIIKE